MGCSKGWVMPGPYLLPPRRPHSHPLCCLVQQARASVWGFLWLLWGAFGPWGGCAGSAEALRSLGRSPWPMTERVGGLSIPGVGCPRGMVCIASLVPQGDGSPRCWQPQPAQEHNLDWPPSFSVSSRLLSWRFSGLPPKQTTCLLESQKMARS